MMAQSKIFITINRPKTSPNLLFCFKKIAHCGPMYNDFTYNVPITKRLNEGVADRHRLL